MKHAAKMIMLCSCDVQKCEDTSATMGEKGEIEKKGRTLTCCVAGAPNDISYKSNTLIPGISIHHFLKDVAVWPVLTRFDRPHQGDLLESVDNKLTRFPFNQLGDDRLLPLRSLRKGETSSETAR